eukprot:gene22774-25799_t
MSTQAELEFRKKKKPDKSVIHPLNNYKVAWDFFTCSLVIYSLIVIPVRVGFSQLTPSIGFVVVDAFIDGMFFLDICLNFNTAYFDVRHESYIYSRPMIASHYLEFWFWVDLVSTIPFDDLVSLI